MWVLICGSKGTCRRKIAEFLEKEVSFRRMEIENKKSEIPDSWSQIESLLECFSFHLDIQKKSRSESIVTVGSTIWEQLEVFSTSFFKRGEISREDYERLKDVYFHLNKPLEPPSAIIHCYGTVMSITSKMSLSSEKLTYSEEFIFHIKDLYSRLTETFASNVLDIDGSGDIAEILEDVRSHIGEETDFRSKTIWDNKVFKYKE